MARVHQAAVIPYRIRKERLEVALVTTSTGKGWIVPKGSVDEGERPRDAAIREGMAGALCRCMTYYRVQAAIRRVAKEAV